MPECVFKFVRAVISSHYQPEAYNLNVWVWQYLSCCDELGPLEFVFIVKLIFDSKNL